MAFQKEVKSLADLTFEVLFLDIVSRLKLTFKEPNQSDPFAAANTQENGPPAKKKKMESVNEAKLSSNQSVINTIRAQLDEYLVSWYSQARWKLFQRFLTTYRSKEHKLFLFFLNSVLDHSFTTCSLRGSKRTKLNFPEGQELLNVICSRSPLVQTLNLSFGTTYPCTFDSLKMGNLNNLTSLSLSLETPSLCINLFSSIGKSCPQLASLHIGGTLSFGTSQVLALMLGDTRHQLSKEFPKKIADMVNIELSPLESLNPVCLSLKHLHYERNNYMYAYNCYYCPPIAFVLRHFPNLEKLECSTCVHIKQSRNQIENTATAAIVYWHEKQHIRTSLRLRGKRTSKSSYESGQIQWTPNSPFNGNSINIYLYYFVFLFINL